MSTRTKYQRTFEELEEVASKFWPSELSDKEAKISVIPILLRTQDQFLSILSIETSELDKFFTILEASDLPANLFIKHLAILADFGGEPLQRISREFNSLFPNGKLNFIWNGNPKSYEFRALPNSAFNNQNLHIDGRHLLNPHPLDDLKRDAIVLLLFGNSYSGDDQEVISALSKCEVGEYIGKPDALNEFVKQRYIWVSRITGGATANNLGQLAQQFVAEYIKDHIGIEHIEIHPGGRLPKVTHTDTLTGRETSFDLVVTNGFKYAAVEISFQVTTNSTIERKAGQARGRFEQIEKAGHKIAYVIDGAGNFQRETAIKTMLAHSHCSVAFARSELEILCEFLSEFYKADK